MLKIDSIGRGKSTGSRFSARLLLYVYGKDVHGEK
jgi:hypothetical protein